MAKWKTQKQDELPVLPDHKLTRKGAVPVKVTARVIRADTGAPLRDLVHFNVRQRGLDHGWGEVKPDARGNYAFEPSILKPGVTWFEVYRVCFAPVVVRARVEASGHVRLGTVRLFPDSALPGTIGVLLSAHRTPRLLPVEVEVVLAEGPAAKAGMQWQDQLLEIDGVPVDVANAERLLRGAPGSPVTVKVRRRLFNRNDTFFHVRPRSLTLTVVRAPGRPTRKRHAMWRA